jgi:predicted transposase YdaD
MRDHIVCMYPLLSMMKGASRRLLKEAIEELAEVYREDEKTLGDFFAYMIVLLERSSTMTSLEKKKTKEVLSMYNSLWDQSPIIQQMRAASKAEGKEEGKAEGEVKAFQRAVVDAVQIRFPLLENFAQQRVGQIVDAEKLHHLYIQILTASDEGSVRSLFTPTVD